VNCTGTGVPGAVKVLLIFTSIRPEKLFLTNGWELNVKVAAVVVKLTAVDSIQGIPSPFTLLRIVAIINSRYYHC
jgi:hypothetical protein